MTCGCVCCVVEGAYPLGWFGVRLRSPFVSSCGFSSCGYSSYPFLGGTLTRLQGVPLPAPRGYPLPVPGGAERLSGLTAPIFRPRCCGFTDGLRTVPGGLRTVYRKRVSAFVVSAFRF